jgi:hypothetical protein
MRTISTVLSLIILASCASNISKSYKQRCSSRDLVLDGVSANNGSGYSYNYATQSSVTNTYSGENLHCVVPKTESQKCEIERDKKILEPIEAYNDKDAPIKTGLWYIAYVIPGVVAKYVYDSQREDAVKKSKEIEKELAGTCEKIAAREAEEAKRNIASQR